MRSGRGIDSRSAFAWLPPSPPHSWTNATPNSVAFTAHNPIIGSSGGWTLLMQGGSVGGALAGVRSSQIPTANKINQCRTMWPTSEWAGKYAEAVRYNFIENSDQLCSVVGG